LKVAGGAEQKKKQKNKKNQNIESCGGWQETRKKGESRHS
jgi:hypothetical protein